MNALDEAKTAHMHKTPQMEQIGRLQAENKALRDQINELRERMIDYQEFLKGLSKLEAIEAWLNDDEDEDETYKTHDGELQ